MRTKVTIGLHVVALGVGALSLYEGWGRVSTILLDTAVAMIFIKNFIAEWVLALFRGLGVSMRPEAEPREVLVAFKYASYTLFYTSVALQWTRGL
jgi:hypothetical protein